MGISKIYVPVARLVPLALHGCTATSSSLPAILQTQREGADWCPGNQALLLAGAANLPASSPFLISVSEDGKARLRRLYAQADPVLLLAESRAAQAELDEPADHRGTEPASQQPIVVDLDRFAASLGTAWRGAAATDATASLSRAWRRLLFKQRYGRTDWESRGSCSDSRLAEIEGAALTCGRGGPLPQEVAGEADVRGNDPGEHDILVEYAKGI